jgi:hypothetical protein
MDTLVALLIAAIVGAFFVRGYLKTLKEQEEKSRASAAKGALFSEGKWSQMYRPRALRRCLSRRRDHDGDGQPEHGRRYAPPDAGV